VAQEWLPHEYVPWSEGRDYADDPWDPSHSRLLPAAQAALEVNLLTEDNLPSYHHEIATRFGRDHAWGAWVHRWTAEEGRHAMCIRDYLLVTRGVDPQALERQRMQIMQAGYDSGGKTVHEALAYVSIQELATRISHRNTGRHVADPVADRLLARVAADENLHMIFYRTLVSAALAVDPSPMVQAICREVTGFAMPGVAIQGFTRKAAQIAQAGIYTLAVHHNDVIWPLLRHWGVFDLEGLSDAAEKARQELAGFLGGLAAAAERQDERMRTAQIRRSSGAKSTTTWLEETRR
jgi:acyl-[acyl-carrier-protein] desaturase